MTYARRSSSPPLLSIRPRCRCPPQREFLVDESLQRHVADLLVDNGHDAVHVSDIGLRGAPDETVLAAADEDSRILITADTDFGTLLALSSQRCRPAQCDLAPPARTPVC